MSKFRMLIVEAKEACSFRGHDMPRIWASDDRHFYACCQKCGRQAMVTISPLPNEIDIGGEAVAVNCNTPTE